MNHYEDRPRGGTCQCESHTVPTSCRMLRLNVSSARQPQQASTPQKDNYVIQSVRRSRKFDTTPQPHMMKTRTSSMGGCLPEQIWSLGNQQEYERKQKITMVGQTNIWGILLTKLRLLRAVGDQSQASTQQQLRILQAFPQERGGLSS